MTDSIEERLQEDGGAVYSFLRHHLPEDDPIISALHRVVAQVRTLRQRVAELEAERTKVLGIIAGIVWSPEGVKISEPFAALRVLVPDPDALFSDCEALRAVERDDGE